MKYHFAVYDMSVVAIPPPEETAAWFKNAVERRGIKIVKHTLHEFESPVPGEHAYTWAFILSASHAIIHTAPEDRWIEVVIALCDEEGDPEDFHNDVVGFFNPVRIQRTKFLGKKP
jgi:S-adenosylmethionine/arginine decarboxylase-like enzyme